MQVIFLLHIMVIQVILKDVLKNGSKNIQITQILIFKAVTNLPGYYPGADGKIVLYKIIQAENILMDYISVVMPFRFFPPDSSRTAFKPGILIIKDAVIQLNITVKAACSRNFIKEGIIIFLVRY